MQIAAAMFFTDYSMSPAELAPALEARGFESLWAPEHSHIPLTRKSPFAGGGDLPKKYYDVMDPFVTLTAAAAVTHTLKLGTGICLVVQRDPIQTAKLVASIDQVSGGRFLFGIGNGWNQDEIENHGTVFATRHKLVRERVAAMQAIWTQTKPEYHGEFVDFGPMMAWPKPVQKPHPPIIVGGAFPYAARRAIRYGNGWIPHRSRPQYGDVSDFSRSSARWPPRPGAAPTICRSPSGGPPRTRTSCGVSATWASHALSSASSRRRRTRYCRNSIVGRNQFRYCSMPIG
jgi:probable F420-dependent oxidoreductase